MNDSSKVWRAESGSKMQKTFTRSHSLADGMDMELFSEHFLILLLWRELS